MMRLGLAMLLLAGAAFGGCTHVVTQDAPYYKDGPQQPGPPDGELRAGTHVWAFERSGSYRRVWTAGGVNAFVWDASVKSWLEWRQMVDEQKRRDKAQSETSGTAVTPAAGKPKSR